MYLQWGNNYSRDIWGQPWLSFQMVYCGKGLITVFQQFFASIDKTFILPGGLATGRSFYEV